MALVVLDKGNTILNNYLAEIRDVQVQQDRLRFRKNMIRCGEILAYEISKSLPYIEKSVQTPLGISNVNVLSEQPVVGSILRAGLAMHEGMLNTLDHADNAFISAYRKHRPDGTFEIALEYISCPPLQNRIFILADPMLATGRSMVVTLQEIFKVGIPRHTHLACVIAARQGIDWVIENVPQATIWACSVDEELDSRSYIVPGLGDAGDLSFGSKMQY